MAPIMPYLWLRSLPKLRINVVASVDLEEDQYYYVERLIYPVPGSQHTYHTVCRSMPDACFV